MFSNKSEQPNWVGFDPTNKSSWDKRSYWRLRLGPVLVWTTIFVVWNLLTTTLTAYLFGWHELLGKPWFGHAGGPGLHQPFSYVWWFIKLYLLPWMQGQAAPGEVDHLWQLATGFWSLGLGVCLVGAKLTGVSKPPKKHLPTDGTAHWATEGELRGARKDAMLVAKIHRFDEPYYRKSKGFITELDLRLDESSTLKPLVAWLRARKEMKDYIAAEEKKVEEKLARAAKARAARAAGAAAKPSAAASKTPTPRKA